MNMGSYSCCTPNTGEFGQVKDLSALLKLVAEESRLKLLCILRRGEHCVCEMMKHVTMSQSLVSHHLRDLKIAGLIKDEKKGVRVYYSLTNQGKLVSDLLFKISIKEEEV